VSLILYALMGGADFGGGVWDLLARGRRARRQSEAIAEAIGPIWEANHVWLILVVVLLSSRAAPMRSGLWQLHQRVRLLIAPCTNLPFAAPDRMSYSRQRKHR
jgi:hypothetical protein